VASASDATAQTRVPAEPDVATWEATAAATSAVHAEELDSRAQGGDRSQGASRFAKTAAAAASNRPHAGADLPWSHLPPQQVDRRPVSALRARLQRWLGAAARGRSPASARTSVVAGLRGAAAPAPGTRRADGDTACAPHDARWGLWRSGSATPAAALDQGGPRAARIFGSPGGARSRSGSAHPGQRGDERARRKRPRRGVSTARSAPRTRPRDDGSRARQAVTQNGRRGMTPGRRSCR
jgi:hypothetical protein